MPKSYLTLENIDDRCRSWLEDIRPFYYDRPSFEFDPKSSALLVIDMQRYFAHTSGRSFLPATGAIVPRLRAILDGFRTSGLPIIFTRHGHKGEPDLGVMGKFWNDFIRFGESDWEIIDELAPRQGEVVIDKNRYDAFFKTPLDSVLEEAGARQVVVTGVMTHLCCEATARSAFVRDYEVYMIADATASSREELHVGTLRALANGFGTVLTSSDVLDRLR